MRRASGKKTAATLPPTVVFETRLLLRTLLHSDARAQALRRAWQQGLCRPLVCPSSARALMLGLAAPALGLTAAQQHELLADYLPYATVVATVPTGLPKSVAVAQNFEQQVLTLAASAGAQLLVSDSASLKASFLQMGGRRPAAAKKTVLLESEKFLAQL